MEILTFLAIFSICQGFFFVKFVLFFILIRYILGISLFYFFGGVFMVADTVRVNFMMSKENLKRVDEACVRWGVNRTAFINFACMNFLRQEELYYTDNFSTAMMAASQMDEEGVMLIDKLSDKSKGAGE
jgi:membrane protein insertase Oxa1/YidC/SpoIIIJ